MALVLIVDDHVDTCHLMERLVRRFGPEVAAVRSGAAALSFLAGPSRRSFCWTSPCPT